MALATYPELLSALSRWTLRTGDLDFEEARPEFVALCESRANRTLRLKEQEVTEVLPLIDGRMDLPADFLEYRAIGDGRRNMTLVSPSFAADVYGQSSNDASFSVVGDQVRSFSSGRSDLAFTYYAAIPPLSDINPTNWLLNKAPEVYLYGSLMETAPFMMDDARIATWGTLYEKAVADLKASDTMSRFAGARVRVRGITP